MSLLEVISQIGKVTYTHGPLHVRVVPEVPSTPKDRAGKHYSLEKLECLLT